MEVIVIGAGVGGLTAALSLHAAGIGVRVFESVSELKPLGVGINVLPHAVRELTELGLEDALARTAIATAELAYHNRHGQLVWQEPRGREAGYRWPQYSIHRGRLQLILAEAVRERLGAEAIICGAHLEHFEEAGGRVRATLVDRRSGGTVETAEGDLLVGADGIHSTVRRALYPDEGAPRFSGMVMWRAVTEAAPFLTGRSMIMAGHLDQKLVAYPICAETAARGRSLVNWVGERRIGAGEAPPREDWNRRVETAAVLPHFAAWRYDWLDIPALIQGAGAIYEFPMVDREPLPRWSFGRVTLLGDAAHPMYPIGSNGASQAILDARTLAFSLATERDVEAGLAAYEAARRPATAAVVQLNRRMGPERVMQLAEERAPGGFGRVEEVFAPGELEAIAGEYKRVAGFEPEALNRRASLSVQL